MDYVHLVNAEERGNVTVVLLDEPMGFELHWDKESNRSRLCPVNLYRLRGIEAPASVCWWCDMEQPKQGYHYAACVLIKPDQEGCRKLVRGMVQLPFVFIHECHERFRRGREILIRNLRVENRKPVWQTGKMVTDDLDSYAFDLVEALMRIKGMHELPAIKSEPKRAGSRDILKFAGKAAS